MGPTSEHPLATISTAEAFNTISETNGWGFVIQPINDAPYRWKLVDGNGALICAAAQEHWAVMMAIMFVQLAGEDGSGV